MKSFRFLWSIHISVYRIFQDGQHVRFNNIFVFFLCDFRMRLSVNSQPPGSRDMLCHVTVIFLVFLSVLLDGTYGQQNGGFVTGGRTCFYNTNCTLKKESLNEWEDSLFVVLQSPCSMSENWVIAQGLYCVALWPRSILIHSMIIIESLV